MTEQEQVEKFGLPYGDDTRYFLQVFKTKDSGDVVGKSKLKAINFGTEKQPTLLFGKEYDSLAPIPTDKAIAYDLKTGMLAPLNGIYTAPVYGGKFPEAAVYANVPTVTSYPRSNGSNKFKYNPLYTFEASGNEDYTDAFNKLNEAIADVEEYSPDKYVTATKGLKRNALNGGVTMAYENSIDNEKEHDERTRDQDAEYGNTRLSGYRLSGKMPYLFPGKSDEDPNSQFYVVAAPKDSLIKSLNFSPDAENYAGSGTINNSDYNRTFARFITPIYKVDSRKYYSDEANSGFLSPDELLKLAELWIKNPELYNKKTKDNSALIKFISDNLNKDPEKLRGISEKIYGRPEEGFYNLAKYFSKNMSNEDDVNALREGIDSFKSKPFARTKLNNFLYDLYLPKIDYLAMVKDLLPVTSKYTGSDRAIKNIRREMSNSLQDFFKQGRISNACIGDRL